MRLRIAILLFLFSANVDAVFAPWRASHNRSNSSTSIGVGATAVSSGAKTVVLAGIATKQAEAAAMPYLSASPTYYCDCGTGASPSCVVGNDAADGLTASTPKRSIAVAESQLATFTNGTPRTIALCTGGAFDLTGTLSMNTTGCAAGTICYELREYQSAFSVAKPVVNNSSAANTVFSWAGAYGGLRILNIKVVGNGTDTGFLFYHASLSAHDVLMQGLDLSGFDVAINNRSATAVTSNVKFIGNYIEGSMTMGSLGAGANAEVSFNHWHNNASNQPLNHTIYISTIGSNVKHVGNYIYGSQTPLCLGGAMMGHGTIDGLDVSYNYIEMDAGRVATDCWGISYTNNTANQSFPIRARNAKFSFNTVVNPGNTGITVSSCPGCVIENNVIAFNWASAANMNGIDVTNYAAQAGRGDDVGTGYRVRNNTVWFGPNLTGTTRGIRTNSEGIGYVIANNTISSEQTSGTLACFDHNRGSDDVAVLPLSAYLFQDNNHCYSTGTYNYARIQLTPNATATYENYTMAAWRTYSGFDAHSIGGAPLFTNPSGYLFSTATGSPLKGAGNNANKSTHGYAGNARPNPPAIGAYE